MKKHVENRNALIRTTSLTVKRLLSLSISFSSVGIESCLLSWLPLSFGPMANNFKKFAMQPRTGNTRVQSRDGFVVTIYSYQLQSRNISRPGLDFYRCTTYSKPKASGKLYFNQNGLSIKHPPLPPPLLGGHNDQSHEGFSTAFTSIKSIKGLAALINFKPPLSISPSVAV